MIKKPTSDEEMYSELKIIEYEIKASQDYNKKRNLQITSNYAILFDEALKDLSSTFGVLHRKTQTPSPQYTSKPVMNDRDLRARLDTIVDGLKKCGEYKKVRGLVEAKSRIEIILKDVSKSIKT